MLDPSHAVIVSAPDVPDLMVNVHIPLVSLILETFVTVSVTSPRAVLMVICLSCIGNPVRSRTYTDTTAKSALSAITLSFVMPTKDAVSFMSFAIVTLTVWVSDITNPVRDTVIVGLPITVSLKKKKPYPLVRVMELTFDADQ